MRHNLRTVHSDLPLIETADLALATYITLHLAPLYTRRTPDGRAVFVFPASAQVYLDSWRHATEILLAEIQATRRAVSR